MDILEALASLDATNDELWTTDGLPKVEVVAALTGNDELKRSDILEAASDFNREFAASSKSPDPNEVAPPSTDSFVFDADSELTEDEQRADYEAAKVDAEVEVVEEAPKTLLEECEAAFVDAQDELNEISKQESTLKAARVELEQKVGYLGGQVDRLKKAGGANQQAIQQYLANNQKIAQEKAEARQAILATGLGDVLKFIGPSALDAAMRQRKPVPANVRRQYPSSITPDKT